jgi:hypothetical protein
MYRSNGGLVERIAAFHGNHVDLARKGGIADEVENEIVEVFIAMHCAMPTTSNLSNAARSIFSASPSFGLAPLGSAPAYPLVPERTANVY